MGHHSDSKTTYKQEFFDREYSAKEAYGRLWGFTRKYRFRIYLGIVCGMLTAGTLLPLFQVIQPALDKVGGGERGAAGEVNGQDARSQSCGVLAWRISGTGEPGGLPSMGSHRVGHN